MRAVQGILVLFLCVSLSQGSYLDIHRRGWLKIASCTTDTVQENYPCEKAFDGKFDDNEIRGWAHDGKGGPDNPASVTFELVKASAVNRIGLLYKQTEYQAKEFQLELKQAEEWVTPENVSVPVEGKVVAGRITLSAASPEIDVSFIRLTDISAVRLTIYGSFAANANTNTILTEILIQNMPDSKCKTVGGNQRDRECIFPFLNLWSGAIHHSCTSDYGLPPWCATRVANDGNMISNTFSGFCDESCAVEDTSTCYGWGGAITKNVFVGSKAEFRRQCIFPFKKDGIWYNECWKNSKDIPLCPVTVDKDGNADSGQNWAYCGTECPGSVVADQCVSATNWKKKGEAKGSRCVFPFRWNNEGEVYKECRIEDNSCATSVGKNLVVKQHQAGYCGKADSCDKDECITTGGPTAGEACRFPFRNPWTKELHFACTTSALEQEVGHNVTFASAPWCATDTAADDTMPSGKWGFCSKKCPKEKQNNCYVDDGIYMIQMKRCIFPFVYKGLTYRQCTYVQGTRKCPVLVDKDGIASEKDMKPCGKSKACYDKQTINGNIITVGYVQVGSYSNDGSKELTIDFGFETGIEDTSESNWNVEASITAGFEGFGASVEASVTAGGGGGSSATSSSQQSHALSYKCPPHTRVVLSQKVLKSGVFESRTFELILEETKLNTKQTTRRQLTAEDISKSRIMN